MIVKDLLEQLTEAVEAGDLALNDEVLVFCHCRSLSGLSSCCTNGRAWQLNADGALDDPEASDPGCPHCAAEGVQSPGHPPLDKAVPVLPKPFTLELAEPENTVIGYEWIKVLAILPWAVVTEDDGDAFHLGNWASAQIVTQWLCETDHGTTILVETDLLEEIEAGVYVMRREGGDDE